MFWFEKGNHLIDTKICINLIQFDKNGHGFSDLTTHLHFIMYLHTACETCWVTCHSLYVWMCVGNEANTWTW